MTKALWIHLTLQSDATFGRGEGLAGLVDEEVEHDRYGLPYLRGRTLKGLLVEECDNLLYALSQQAVDIKPWNETADRLFGHPDSWKTAIMRISDARLPDDLRRAVRYEAEQAHSQTLDRLDVLESLTALRRQTAIDETGKAEDKSLRTMRVILRQTPFTATLIFRREPTDRDLALLSACVLAFRRAGIGRNRGRGHLAARLLDSSGDITAACFEEFQKEVKAQ